LIEGVLLDVDGTLVDSNLAHARAWRDAFDEARVDAPSVENIHRLIGMGGDKLLPAAVGLTEDSPLGKRLAERRSQIFLERYLFALRPTDGAGELVEALQRHRLRLGIATSAKPDELRGLLERAGVPVELADLATSGEEVDSSKPDPDVVQAALERLSLPPEAVVLIGDTRYDVEAGNRAGVGVVAVRCGGWSDEDLQGAIAIFDDPGDVAANLDTVLSTGRRPAA
jgi:HAD superfamily hydrolase (TIGR01509 family)